MTDSTHIRMTASEYAKLPESNQITELIDGEVIVTPAPDDAHQKTSGHTYLVLARLVRDGELRYAPTDVHLDEINTVQPDLFWVSGENQKCRLVEGAWEGPPDLVVEILSPSTAHRDYREKYNLYEKYGVREYWIIDPIAKFVEVYTHSGTEFVRQGEFKRGQTFVSPILYGQMIQVDPLLG
jgi:Uma2 family endonuclease